MTMAIYVILLISFFCYFYNHILVYVPLAQLFGLIDNNRAPTSNRQLLAAVLYNPPFIFCSLASVCRIWLLYYDIHLSKLQLQQVWLNAIDPNIVNQNWFKKHQSTLGNANYLIKYGFIITMVYSISNGVARFTTINDANTNTVVANFFDLVETGIIVFVGLIFGILIFKLRNVYYDTLGIKKELCLSFKCALILTILDLAINLGDTFLNIMTVDDTYFFGQYTIFVSCMVFIYMLTLLPKRLLKQSSIGSVGYNCRDIYSCCWNKCCNGKLKGDDSEKDLDIRSKTLSSLSGVNYRWSDIVCTQFGFESLMDHLEKEFSVETLLFIFEVRIELTYKFCCVN